MYISNVEELVEALKPKLKDYLISKIGNDAALKSFKCFLHEDGTPSMAFNPKTDNTTVHCFGCGGTADIFSAANHFENLPATGSEWITQTLPTLAERFGVLIKLGDTTPADKERSRLYKLMSDIANVLAGHRTKTLEDYLLKRSWSDEKLIIGNISQQDLIPKLTDIGWDATALYSTLLINAKNPIFADDRITFVIRDYRGRPIGFVARNLSNEGSKYVNSPESLIYEKSRVLLGLDTAIAEAKKSGIFIVEGPGDLAALHRVGIFNAVATCGTAFTSEHLHLLKMLGIRQAYFALDWDEAGKKAMRRILKEELKFATGVSCFVVDAPKTGEKDVSELLEGAKDYQAFTQLRKVPAFEWVLQIATHSTPEELCAEMIPIIASESTSVRREILIKVLADKTGISFTSIKEDIAAIRDSKTRERNERLEAAANKYHKDIQNDPANAQVILTQHQNDLFAIEKEFNRQPQGVDYQLSRYDALQHNKLNSETECSEFIMGRYKLLGHALSGGMSWTESTFVVVGGRANSGKTATCLAIATDIALHDENAIVIGHFTDDSYIQVEPRIKCNIASMIREADMPHLTIGMSAAPKKNLNTKAEWEVYYNADKTFRHLIEEERLFILDQEDGKNLATLERTLRQIRNRYPEKKIFIASDGLHNYQDFLGNDQTTRMTRISSAMKDFTSQYKCSLWATGQYRKNMPFNRAELKLPVDDDLADARALMYDPNLIMHVYNDIHDRGEDAAIFWEKKELPGVRLPRLLLCITKNKLTEFKDKLVLNMDPKTVSLTEVDALRARLDSERHSKSMEEDQEGPDTTGRIMIEADYD